MRRGMIFRMRSDTRRCRFIKHCLVVCMLGFVATVMSAWVSAWAALPANQTVALGYPAGWSWGLEVPESWPASPRGATYFAPTIRIIDGVGPQIPPPGVRYRVREGLHTGSSGSPTTGWTFFNGEDPRYATDALYMGWPLRSMTHRGPTDARPLPKNSRLHSFYNGISVPEIQWLGLKANRHLPLQPLLMPFLVSVLIFGVLIEFVWQMILLPGRLRRRKWRRTGACLACGYAIEDLGVCPECGVEVGTDT